MTMGGWYRYDWIFDNVFGGEEYYGLIGSIEWVCGMDWRRGRGLSPSEWASPLDVDVVKLSWLLEIYVLEGSSCAQVDSGETE